MTVTLCSVRNNGVSVCASDTVWKGLLELATVFSGAAVDGGWRRYTIENAVAVISGITKVERGSGIDACGWDGLLIAVLPVEDENILEGRQ